MKVDLKKLKTLRAETDVSIALCNKALIESNNDYEKAKEILKKMGLALAEKKLGKTASEGIVASYIHHNKKIGVLLTLNCETDFVGKNHDFQALAQEIAMQIAAMNPKNVQELLKQDYIRDNGRTISDLIKENIAKLGENIEIKEFIRYTI